MTDSEYVPTHPDDDDMADDAANDSASHESLSRSDLADLRRRARPLKPKVFVGKSGLSEGTIAQIRRALSQEEIVKVRVGTQDRAEAEAAGKLLAESIPCGFLGRVGFVITLYRTVDAPE